MHPLRDSWLKVERAGKHLNTLNKTVRAFESSKRQPYDVRRQFDSERSEYIWYGVIRRYPSPNIPLILGDFIHNLRSALDHLAYASRSIYAPIDDEDTQFPIFDRSTQFDVKALSLRYIRTDIRDHMQTFQPYHGLNDRERRFLRTLRDLSNLDKHRRIALVAAYVHVPCQESETVSGVKRFELVGQTKSRQAESGVRKAIASCGRTSL